MLTTNVLRRGRDEPPAEQITLRAGPLEAIFEPEAAWLRYIRLGEHEMVRAIYVAVRDRLWLTALPRLSDLKIEQPDGGFRVSFTATCLLDDIDFVWQGSIVGQADGTIRYAMDGQARSTFVRNRIGFCVLHPMDCAGQPCELIRPDGSGEHGQFPAEISAHQPFMNLAGIVQPLGAGVSAELRFEGDVFETEDQRNWTDASFKTYCTPLELPRPIEITKGTTVKQAVTLRLHGQATPRASSTPQPRPIAISFGGKTLDHLPGIGVGLASHPHPPGEREINLLRQLKLDHLRADLHLADEQYEGTLRQAAAESAGLPVPLELAVFVGETPEPQLERLLKQMQSATFVHASVTRWLVFGENQPVSASALRAAREVLLRYYPQAAVATGTNQYFTELNRQRPPAEGAEFVSYSLNPQVHAFDDRSVMETIEAQAATAESARRLYPQQAIVISPITLRPRFNPHQPDAGLVDASGLPRTVDVRQMSLFTAAWTLGSIRRLAGAGVASLTYFETTGWRGVIETAAGPAQSAFPSFPSAAFPIFHLLADLADFRGGRVDLCQCSHPLVVEGLAITSGGQRAMLLANLTPEPQTVHLPDEAGRTGGQPSVRYLDDTTAEFAMRSPEEFRASAPQPLEDNQVRLGSYAVARVEWH
ncbi:MAG: hypothetical protein HY000_37275 [Planctomycetes bacterium]|nr:hypothetical protein [Planctomycetota bacterium]